MAFTPRTDWKNKPDTSTPILAEDMVRIEQGVAAAHDLVEPAGLGVVGVAHAVFVEAGGTVPAGLDDYTLVIEV